MNVSWLESLSLELADGRVLICDSFHLLLLDARWSNIHSKNDILGLTHGETGDIYVIFLCVVSQDKVFKLNFNVDPLFIGESGPNMVWLCHDWLVWSEDNLRSLWVQMQSTQDKNEPAEAREALNTLLPVVIQVE